MYDNNNYSLLGFFGTVVGGIVLAFLLVGGMYAFSSDKNVNDFTLEDQNYAYATDGVILRTFNGFTIDLINTERNADGSYTITITVDAP